MSYYQEGTNPTPVNKGEIFREMEIIEENLYKLRDVGESIENSCRKIGKFSTEINKKESGILQSAEYQEVTVLSKLKDLIHLTNALSENYNRVNSNLKEVL